MLCLTDQRATRRESLALNGGRSGAEPEAEMDGNNDKTMPPVENGAIAIETAVKAVAAAIEEVGDDDGMDKAGNEMGR